MFSRHSPDGTVRSITGGSVALVGASADQLIGLPVSDLVHADDAADVRDWFAAVAGGRSAERTAIVRTRRASGRWAWTEMAVEGAEPPSGGGLVVAWRDVDSWVESIQALASSERQFRQAFDHAPVGIAVTDAAGRLVTANGTLYRVLGRAEGSLGERWLEQVMAETDHEELAANRRHLLRQAGPAIRRERRFVDGDGGIRWGAFTSTGHVLPDGTDGILMHLEDITDLKEAQDELVHAALHDALTDLPNRALVLEQIRSALSRSQRHGTRAALLFFDIDGLKQINDTFGHVAGDELLVTVARRMTAVIEDMDAIAGRLSGDEFVVLVEDVTSTADVLSLAEEVTEAMRPAISLGAEEMLVSLSVGVAISETGLDAEELVERADRAMYKAKQRGRSRWVQAEPRVEAAAVRQLEVEAALRKAIDGEDLVLHYQPIVDMARRVVGAEALVRWQRAESTLWFPESFLDVAEATDLIVEIGDWVIREGCREAARWQREFPDRNLTVSCNVAARHLTDGQLTATIRRALAGSGLAPHRLQVEITETQLIAAGSDALAELRRQQADGVVVAVDDFGVATAPLVALRQLPVSLVKIDPSFIAGLAHDSTDSAMVEAVINLAHTTGCQVAAKGVETVAQWGHLLRLGCDLAQGRLLHDPMPGAAFWALVARESRAGQMD